MLTRHVVATAVKLFSSEEFIFLALRSHWVLGLSQVLNRFLSLFGLLFVFHHFLWREVTVVTLACLWLVNFVVIKSIFPVHLSRSPIQSIFHASEWSVSLRSWTVERRRSDRRGELTHHGSQHDRENSWSHCIWRSARWDKSKISARYRCFSGRSAAAL